MKLKKIPRTLALASLTLGASLILGFLSFSGMLALSPMLPLALGAFGFAVAYEGEIYLQNIKGALNKLFKPNYLKHQLAKLYLLEKLGQSAEDPERPQFFNDFEANLNQLKPFEHAHLDAASRIRKKRIEKNLTIKERWFAQQLFSSDTQALNNGSDYQTNLHHWLRENQQTEWNNQYKRQHKKFRFVKGFSALAGLFMGLGTTYLLMDAVLAIPFLAALSATAWPIAILPMAAVAGAAYGLLTYNTITDMLMNNTFHRLVQSIKKDWQEGRLIRSALIAVAAGSLITLALALTACTAGTWWTIAQKSRPLFAWMEKMPTIIMGGINPLITGMSSVAFNLQNSAETLEMLNEYTQDAHSHAHTHPSWLTRLRQAKEKLLTRENEWQIINPFRLLLKLTVTPLRIVFFLTHLISISLTADQVPGMHEIVAILLGFLSEGFEDMHYFNLLTHDCSKKSHNLADLRQARLGQGHDHHHDQDLPSTLLKALFTPIYLLASFWDFTASQNNQGSRRVLSWDMAWKKQTGVHAETSVAAPESGDTSPAWLEEHIHFRITRHIENELQGAWVGHDVAQRKIMHLRALQENLRQNFQAAPRELAAHAQQRDYAIHRFFQWGTPQKTNTTLLLDELETLAARHIPQ